MAFQLLLFLQVVGIILAIVSGLLIGCSFVFKKKGLLRSQANGAIAGEGVAYLKSVRSMPILFHMYVVLIYISCSHCGGSA